MAGNSPRFHFMSARLLFSILHSPFLWRFPFPVSATRRSAIYGRPRNKRPRTTYASGFSPRHLSNASDKFYNAFFLIS